MTKAIELPRCHFLYAREFRELYVDAPPRFMGVVIHEDGGCEFVALTAAERASLGLGADVQG